VLGDSDLVTRMLVRAASPDTSNHTVLRACLATWFEFDMSGIVLSGRECDCRLCSVLGFAKVRSRFGGEKIQRTTQE
jgi:hypothetical protein